MGFHVSLGECTGNRAEQVLSSPVYMCEAERQLSIRSMVAVCEALICNGPGTLSCEP